MLVRCSKKCQTRTITSNKYIYSQTSASHKIINLINLDSPEHITFLLHCKLCLMVMKLSVATKSNVRWIPLYNNFCILSENVCSCVVFSILSTYLTYTLHFMFDEALQATIFFMKILLIFIYRIIQTLHFNVNI